MSSASTYALQYVKAIHNLTEDHVLAVQLRNIFCKGDVELGGVGISAAIGHTHNSKLVMLQFEAILLVVEFPSINGITSRAVTCLSKQRP